MNSGIIYKKEKSKQLKSKVNLKKLKSDYILKRIYDIIKQNKSLKIVKYNKKLQKRLNLNINDYKKYAELYSSIEIELKLVDNIYGKFVNILDEE